MEQKMTADQKIAHICKDIDGLTYHYNDWSRANVDIEALQFPVLINLLPVDGQFVIKNGQIKDFPNCMFGFLDVADFDAQSAENETVVARMKEYAGEFIGRVNSSGLFEAIDGQIRYQVVYDKLDINVTGVMVPLTLKERTGICL